MIPSKSSTLPPVCGKMTGSVLESACVTDIVACGALASVVLVKIAVAIADGVSGASTALVSTTVTVISGTLVNVASGVFTSVAVGTAVGVSVSGPAVGWAVGCGDAVKGAVGSGVDVGVAVKVGRGVFVFVVVAVG